MRRNVLFRVVLMLIVAVNIGCLAAQGVMNIQSVGNAVIPYEYILSRIHGDELWLYNYEITGQTYKIKRGVVNTECLVSPLQEIFSITIDADNGALSDDPVYFCEKGDRLYSAIKTPQWLYIYETIGDTTTQHSFNISGLYFSDTYNPLNPNDFYITDDGIVYISYYTYPTIGNGIYYIDLADDTMLSLYQGTGYGNHWIASFGDEYFLFYNNSGDTGQDLVVQGDQVIQTIPGSWILHTWSYSNIKRLCGDYFQVIVNPLAGDYYQSYLVWLEDNTLQRIGIGSAEYPYSPLSYSSIITHSDSTFTAIESDWAQASIRHKKLVNGQLSNIESFPDLSLIAGPWLLKRLDAQYDLVHSWNGSGISKFTLVDYPRQEMREYDFTILPTNNVFWPAKIACSSRYIYIHNRTNWTGGRKVYLLKLQMSTDADEELIPQAMPELAVYPNPFRESCRISLKKASIGELELGIYNLRGQCVRQISTRISEPVEWTYNWDGKDTRGNTLAKGIYFVRIETGGGVISRKLLYLD